MRRRQRLESELLTAESNLARRPYESPPANLREQLMLNAYPWQDSNLQPPDP